MPTLLLLTAVLSPAADAPGQGVKVHIGRLIRRLADEDFETRTEAEKSLAELGERAREPLRQAMKTDKDLEVITRCRRLLAKLGPGPIEKEIARLIEGLGDDSYDVRTGSQKRLIGLGVEALPQLREARRRTPDVEIKNRSAEIIRRIERGE